MELHDLKLSINPVLFFLELADFIFNTRVSVRAFIFSLYIFSDNVRDAVGKLTQSVHVCPCCCFSAGLQLLT